HRGAARSGSAGGIPLQRRRCVHHGTVHSGGWRYGDGVSQNPMRQVRQMALKSLYEAETSEHSALEAFERQRAEAMKHDPKVGKARPGAYERTIIAGVIELRYQLDEYIQE